MIRDLSKLYNNQNMGVNQRFLKFIVKISVFMGRKRSINADFLLNYPKKYKKNDGDLPKYYVREAMINAFLEEFILNKNA